MLPFQVGHRASPSNAPLPDRLPFAVAVDERTGMVVQRRDRRVSMALDEAYRRGSQMGTPLSCDGVGRAQLDDVAAFIEESLDGEPLTGRALLEIGCGDGALLAELQRRGARVGGLEPGEAAAAAARSRGLPVRCEPFDAASLGGERFDLIVHHAVLEHVEHPQEFIADQLGLLAPGGRIICCVPDCAAAIVHGDLSMLVHEHWSYFDSQTLLALGGAAGARTARWRLSRSAGAIYCAWEPHASVQQDPPPAPPYIDRARRALRAIVGVVEDAASSGSSLGIYCGGRFVNYHALAPGEAGPAAARWFDDDPALHGRFYPPVPIAVESRAALLADPVEELLIASWTFGEALRAELEREPALSGTRIRTFADVLPSGGTG